MIIGVSARRVGDLDEELGGPADEAAPAVGRAAAAAIDVHHVDDERRPACAGGAGSWTNVRRSQQHDRGVERDRGQRASSVPMARR